MFDEKTLAALQANYRPFSFKAPSLEKKKGRSGLAKWAPAIGGAAAGIAAAPFTGGLSLAATLAAIGGAAALGSAAGEFGAQKSSDEKTDVGKIVKEGAIGGALGAIPLGGVGRAAKVARTAGSGTASRTANIGNRLRQDVANPRVTAGVSGAQKEATIASRISNVPGLSARAKYGNLQKEVDNISAQIKPILAKSKKTVDSKNLLTAVRTNAEESGHFLAGDPLYERQLSSAIADITAKTGGKSKLPPGQLFEYKKNMNMDTVFKKIEKGTDLNPKEASRLAVWSSLDSEIAGTAPAVKKLTQEQSLLIQGAPGLKSSSTKTAGIPILGVKSQGVERGFQATKELAGRGLQKLGGANTNAVAGGLAGAIRPGSGATTEFLKQGLGRAVANPQPMDEPSLQGAVDPLQDPLYDPLAAGMDPMQETQSLYSLEQALADIQRDPENSAQYLSIYKTVAADEKARNPNKPLGATQQKEATNAQSGLQSIQDLQTMIQSNPGVVGKSAIPGQTTLVGGYLSNALGTGEYNAAAQNIRDVISRLRSGAALTEQEEQRYKSLVPKAGDSSQTIEYKLSSLATLFQNFANPQQSGGGDLTDVLSQLQGSYPAPY